jgi:signal transduction histidine kinase
VESSSPLKKGLAHTLNNPLAALLAELQLLEMEQLPVEQRESVERCIGLCRRVIGIVRERIPPTMD